MGGLGCLGSLLVPLTRGALARLLAASLRSSAAALAPAGKLFWPKLLLNFPNLYLLLYFFLAELTGRAPGNCSKHHNNSGP